MRISDWSSDVCSSDLCQMKGYAWKSHPGGALQVLELVAKATEVLRRSRDTRPTTRNPPVSLVVLMRTVQRRSCGKEPQTMRKQIGRASCRERVCQYV